MRVSNAKAVLRGGASALVLTLAVAWAGESFAQDISEVVVTARKREENLQDIPLSISAFASRDRRRTSPSRPRCPDRLDGAH